MHADEREFSLRAGHGRLLDCGGRAQRRHRFRRGPTFQKRRGASLPAAVQNRWLSPTSNESHPHRPISGAESIAAGSSRARCETRAAPPSQCARPGRGPRAILPQRHSPPHVRRAGHPGRARPGCTCACRRRPLHRERPLRRPVPAASDSPLVAAKGWPRHRQLSQPISSSNSARTGDRPGTASVADRMGVLRRKRAGSRCRWLGRGMARVRASSRSGRSNRSRSRNGEKIPSPARRRGVGPARSHRRERPPRGAGSRPGLGT